MYQLNLTDLLFNQIYLSNLKSWINVEGNKPFHKIKLVLMRLIESFIRRDGRCLNMIKTMF